MADALLKALETGAAAAGSGASSGISAAAPRGPAGSLEELAQRVQKLEIREQLHAKAIVMQSQDIEIIKTVSEVVVWIVAYPLKNKVTFLEESWRRTKPEQGPHPLGSMGHVTLAAVLRAVGEVMHGMQPEGVVKYLGREDAAALKLFMPSSEPQAIHTAMLAKLAELMMYPMA